MYGRLLAHEGLNAHAVAGMRLFVSGSAPLLAPQSEAFTARTFHTILERYGMSETIMLTSNPYRADARHGGQDERRGGTVGFALPGVVIGFTFVTVVLRVDVLSRWYQTVPVLVAAKLLKPLGNPAQNSVKFFATREVQEQAKNLKWLNKATVAIYQHWHSRNARRKETTEDNALSPAT